MYIGVYPIVSPTANHDNSHQPDRDRLLRLIIDRGGRRKEQMAETSALVYNSLHTYTHTHPVVIVAETTSDKIITP